MKLVFVDKFAEENNKKYKCDCFFEGDLAYFEVESGSKLMISSYGEQYFTVNIAEAKQKGTTLASFDKYDEDVIVIRSAEEARYFFVNGEEDLNKMIDFVEWDSNNWLELSYISNKSDRIYQDEVGGLDLMTLEEFINLSDSEVKKYIDYFENID